MGWKYIEGNEESFKNCPEGATERLESDKGGNNHLVGWLVDGWLVGINGYKEKFEGLYGYRIMRTAKREKVSDDKEPTFLPVEDSYPQQGEVWLLKEDIHFYTQDGTTVFPKGTSVVIGGEVNFDKDNKGIIVKILGTYIYNVLQLNNLTK